MISKKKFLQKRITPHVVPIAVFLAFIAIPPGSLSGENGGIEAQTKLSFGDSSQSIPASYTLVAENDGSIEGELKGAISDKLRAIRNKPLSLQANSAYSFANKQSSQRISASGVSDQLKVCMRKNTGTPGFIRAQKGYVLKRALSGYTAGKERDVATARACLKRYSRLLRINDPDNEMRMTGYQADAIGRTHVRYTQEYKGLSLWPTDMIVHLDRQGNVDKMNGATVATPRKMHTKPVVSLERASERARSAIPAGKSARVANPGLVVYAPGKIAPRLAWKLEILAAQNSQWLVIIDALNGSMLDKYNLIQTADVAGSGVDLFNRTQDLSIWEENSSYYMINTAKQMYDTTSNPPAVDQVRGGIVIQDARNQLNYLYNVVSTSPSAGWLPDAVSAAWNLSKVYDYYYERHGSNSFDGRGSTIRAIVRYGDTPALKNNAFYNSSLKVIGLGNAQPFAGSLDVIGHEFTHGVVAQTARLVYEYQSGALNEAFADIFGEMAERHAMGECDFIIASALSSDIQRSLSKPYTLSIPYPPYHYPSTMSEYVYLDKTKDNGGVHINSTIVSYAFYLLAEGLNGAIGIHDAESIFYRALVYHLVSQSQFIDARQACISSAEELFGQNSTQALKTAEAFDAVQIPDDSSTPTPPPPQPVSGTDSVLFVYYDNEKAGHYLGRREGQDPAQGVGLSTLSVNPSRPSVSGDGRLAVYVDSRNDICFIPTDRSGPEEPLGLPGSVHSVAMSPDCNSLAFVFLQDDGERDSTVCIYDYASDTMKKYDLVSPVIDGVSMNTVLYADAMDFTADGRYLIYDAFNVLKMSDSTETGVWSIYAIDLATQNTMVLLPPLPSCDIAFPAMSRINKMLITFDAYDTVHKTSTIYVGNLSSSELSPLIEDNSDYGVPGFNGDDTAIVYAKADESTTGHSLWKAFLSVDHMDMVGNPGIYLSGGDYGVVYRRGTYNLPTSSISVSPEVLTWGSVPIGQVSNQTLTITNNGGSDLSISSIALSGNNSAEFLVSGTVQGRKVPPAGSYSIQIGFTPGSSGEKTAVLAIKTDNIQKPVVNVSLSGTGQSAGNESSVDNSGSSQEDPGDIGSDLEDSREGEANTISDSGGGGGGGCFMDTASGTVSVPYGSRSPRSYDGSLSLSGVLITMLLSAIGMLLLTKHQQG